jgi:phosphoserine phosphatase
MFSRATAVLDLQHALGEQSARQVAHWVLAAARLDLDELASREAWGHLERYLGISLRRHLEGVIERLKSQGRVLTTLHREARSATAHAEVRQRLLEFQRQYLRTERTLEFFADAINSRTNPQVAAVLRACDTLAQRSMAQVLDALGKTTPPALTYLGEGRGASILKAHQRLWDGGEICPVAAIKLTYHNALRPTALIHEAGHQVAHITGWNEELASALAQRLQAQGASAELAEIWASWASEISADAFSFAHTGFASIAALHDVVDGDAAQVFRYLPGDPHPISYLRVLLGVQMCRHFYAQGAAGDAPWDVLALAWTGRHALEAAPAEVCAIARDSLPLLEAIVQIVLEAPMRAFAGRALRHLVMPERVSPASLDELGARIGNALFTSAHWLWTEPLRILGLTGLRLALTPRDAGPILELQRQSMLRLGGALQTV